MASWSCRRMVAAALLVCLPALSLAMNGLQPLLALQSGPSGSLMTGDRCGPMGTGHDPAACAGCHPAFHQEWLDSMHAKAFTDPIYQQALRGLDRPGRCHGCHVPDSVLGRIGHPPLARTGELEHGVSCAACHRSGQAIHGPFGASNDAHESWKDPSFRPPGVDALCASCHGTKIGPVLPVARDFFASDLQSEGKSCVGCHMQRVERPLAVVHGVETPSRMTRSHRLLGPSDPEFCASAFLVELQPESLELVVSVANGAGHRVPGLTLRTFPIHCVQFNAGGRQVRTESVTISAENELRVAEERIFRFLRDAEATRAVVTVEHWFQGRRVAVLKSSEATW